MPSTCSGSSRSAASTVERLSGPGSPVVFASLDVPSPRGTIVLYIHYDGQPVNPAEWTRCKPFEPCVYGASGEVRLDAGTRLDPEWRVYGRSASDDKGPIVAVLKRGGSAARRQIRADVEPARGP